MLFTSQPQTLIEIDTKYKKKQYVHDNSNKLSSKNTDTSQQKPSPSLLSARTLKG